MLARTEQLHVGSRDHQHHAAGEPPGPRRRARRDDGPPLERPLRVRHRPRLVDHRAGRLRHHRPRAHPRHVRRGRSASSRRCGATSTYSFDGQFFSMPERNVLPKPYVKPHPPMWVAAGNPGTFEKAAQMGLGVLCFTGGAPEKMAPLVELYKKNIKNAEPVGEFVNDNVAVTTSFMCLEDRDEARELDDALGQRSPAEPRVPLPRHVPEAAVGARVAGRRSPTRRSSRSRRASETGASIVGTPTTAPKALQKWEDVGVDQLIMGPSGSVYPHDLLEQTVKLFGDEVIPRFDKDPEHSTEPLPPRSRRAPRSRLSRVPTLARRSYTLVGVNSHDDLSQHPDLAATSAAMRAAWREEQEAATRDAAEDWHHRQTLVDRLRAHMHRGDGVTVTVLGRRDRRVRRGSRRRRARAAHARRAGSTCTSRRASRSSTRSRRPRGRADIAVRMRSADRSVPHCSCASGTRACCSGPLPIRTGAPARCASAATTSCSRRRTPRSSCRSRASAGCSPRRRN